MVMVTLFCAIVGKEVIAPVEIEDDKSVGILKKAIANETKYCLDQPHKLNLYMAKENGSKNGDWMKDDDEEKEDGEGELVQLQQATIPDNVEKMYLHKDTLLKTTGSIRKYFTGVPTEDVIHVLVVVPEGAGVVERWDGSNLDEQIKNAVKQAFDEQEKSKRKCVALSHVSGAKRKDILAYMHASIAVLDVKEPVVKKKDEIPVFQWSELDEDQQVDQYMDYLNEYLHEDLRSHGLALIDVSTRKQLLNVKDERLPFDLSGGTDVLIMRNMGSFEVQQMKHFPGLRLVIELKKNLDTQKEFDDGEAQTLAELIAVDILAHESAVVLLTDLNHVWNFMWLGRNKTIMSLFLREPHNAFSLIRQVISKRENEWDLHIPFAKNRDDRLQKRIKLNEMIPTGSGTDIGEMLERYQSMSSFLGPDIDMAREIGLQVVKEMPVYHSMFT